MSTSDSEIRTTKRQSCPLKERKRLVELTLEEGASLSKIANAHDVHPSSLSHWRSLYRVGKLGTGSSKKKSSTTKSSTSFLPVKIASAEAHVQALPKVSHSSAATHERTTLHMTAPSGLTLRIETSLLNIDLFAAVLAEVRACTL